MKHNSLLFLALIFKISIAEIQPNDEYNLVNHLFENYSPEIRPVKAWKDSLDIEVALSLLKVADVIESNQNMILHVNLQFIWNDFHLKWDPKDYKGLSSISVASAMVWFPNIHLFNSATEEHDVLRSVNVEIFSNGTLISSPLNHLNAHCNFDFARFPYDTQKCSFNIVSTTHESKLRLKLKAQVNKQKLFPNPEWKYVSHEVNDDNLDAYPITDIDLNWSSATFTIVVKRESSFFVNLFMWPLIFILLLISCIFILPPSCVERVTLGVLILLTLIIMLLMLDSYTPRNSFSSWPIVGKLISFNMFMATLSTLVSTLIIGINQDTFLIKRIPANTKNMLLVLAKISFKSETAKAILFPEKSTKNEEIPLMDVNHTTNVQESVARPSSNNELSQVQTMLILISNQLAMLRMRFQEKETKSEIKQEWNLVAIIFDRLCIIFYFITIFFGLIFINS